MDLDLRRVRHFSVVAHRLSFVRAAAQLHMTQPALTRQIQALESDLGVKLFDRDRRGTTLTSAGQELLDSAEGLLAAAAEIERRVRAAARGERRFTIGFMPGVPTTDLVRDFAATAPELIIETVFTPMIHQEDYLLDGRVDVCFVRLPLRSTAISAIPILDEPRVAVLPESSPLVDRASVRVGDLQVHPLIDDRASVPGWQGDTLPRDDPYTTVEDRLEAVASGSGVAVMPSGVADFYRRPDVVLMPIDDIAPITVALGFLGDREMPELEMFARLARGHLGARG